MVNTAEIYFTKLSDKARQSTKNILKDNQINREACLEEIRTWLNSEVHWIKARTEDRYLLQFLLGCKFNIPKTKQKILNFYTMKKERPEWFQNRNPLNPELKELIKMGVFLPLKQPHENKMIIIVRAAAHDPKKYHWNDVIKVGNMILDVASLENEYAPFFGVIAIFDMSGMSFAHYRSMTPSFIKNAVSAFQNYHVQPKQLECINAPTYLTIILSIFKSFMTEKMRNRVKVHFGGVEKAQEIVSKEVLPIEYGGSGDSIETLGELWHEKLVEYSEWFQEDEMYKAQ